MLHVRGRLPAPRAHRPARPVADARRDLRRRDGRADLRRARPQRRQHRPGDRLDLGADRPVLAGGRCILALARRQARIAGLAGKPTLIVGARRGRRRDRPAPGRSARVRAACRSASSTTTRPPTATGTATAPRTALRTLPVLGAPADLAEVAADNGAQHVIFAFTHERDQSLLALARALRGARPRGLARAAPVRVDERPRGARLGRQPAAARHPPARPEGLAVPRQVRARPADRRCSA